MQRNCDVCGVSYEAKRSSSKYCSSTCRQRAFARPDVVFAAQDPPPPAHPMLGGSLEAATLRELTAAAQQDSSLGMAALILARRLDGISADSGSSMAAVVREHRVTLQAAVDSGKVEADPLDELAVRRRERRARA